MSTIVAALKAADLSDLPPVDSLADDRGRVLWVLSAGARSGEPLLTAAEVSVILRDVCRIDLSRQRVQALLARERGTVARRKKGGSRAYQIMQAGDDLIAAATSTTVVFIEPSRALSKIREAEEFLAGLGGGLSVCDPYVDGRTLDVLAVCKKASMIRLLTANIAKAKPFRRDLVAFNREHRQKLDVRVAAEKDIHDRYVIHDGGLLLFGTSLNGLGKRQSFVVALGKDLQTDVGAAFETRWQEASPI